MLLLPLFSFLSLIHWFITALGPSGNAFILSALYTTLSIIKYPFLEVPFNPECIGYLSKNSLFKK